MKLISSQTQTQNKRRCFRRPLYRRSECGTCQQREPNIPSGERRLNLAVDYRKYQQPRSTRNS